MLPWFTTLPFVHLINYASRQVYHSARFEKESRYYVIRLSKDLLEPIRKIPFYRKSPILR